MNNIDINQTHSNAPLASGDWSCRLIDELLKVKSCSVVGMEKNTGKTVTLDYILGTIPLTHRIAVTSIGLDGETKDQVFGTHKPEIHLRPGQLFATSEKHYRMRHLTSELINVSETQTALGRLVTAVVLIPGKVLLSGPGSTAVMRSWMDTVEDKADLILIDGALSRMSLAAPTVSEAMILATGAAYSLKIDKLVRDTAYKVELINLPIYERTKEECELSKAENQERPIYIQGALTDGKLDEILRNKEMAGKDVLVPDFTHIFATELLWHRFCRTHRVYVERRSRLIGITVNPTSPQGMRLPSEELTQRLTEATGVHAVDLIGI